MWLVALLLIFLREQVVRVAERLLERGVPVEPGVYPGAQRAFDFRRNMRTEEGAMMEERVENARVSRRSALRVLGLLGVSAAGSSLLGGPPVAALGQGTLGALQPEEKVDATLRRLFGSRPIKDGSSVIKMDLPLIAENGASVQMAVEVQSPMTPTNYVKTIYIISDKNRRPLNAQFSFTPEMGAASIGANLRLGETTDVRAIAELSDGTLLMAKREVKVTVGGCGG